MHQLAFIALVGADGKDLAVCAAEVLSIRERHDGSTLTLRNGTTLDTQSTVSAVVTAIDTLWTEYTTALGDPA